MPWTLTKEQKERERKALIAYQRSLNWGGARPGAGRKRAHVGYDEDMKPHSVYCSDAEMDYLKAFLKRLRQYRALLVSEPGANGPTTYEGTHEKWEKALEALENQLSYERLASDITKNYESQK